MHNEKIHVDVEGIMNEIRTKIRAEELAAAMPPFSSVPMDGQIPPQPVQPQPENEENWPLFLESLGYMNHNYEIPYYWSFGPAGLKTFVKRVVRKLAKCIIPPILAKQGQFNVCVVRCMNTARHFMEGQRRINDQLREENRQLRALLEGQGNQLQELIHSQESKLQALHQEQNEKVNQLKQQQEELSQKTNHTETELCQLQDKTGMYVDGLIEAQEQLRILADEGAFITTAKDADAVKSSVSQSGEDMILEYIFRALGVNIQNITYLDLGANHAKYLSNTYYFYKRGARGVLVEANPELISELKFYRHGDIILNNCISDKSGEIVDFYLLNGDGLSTPNREGAEAALAENSWLKIEKTVQVKTISVQEIFDRYFDQTPTVINLDIEGKEMEILNSIDFTRHRPLIMIIETIPYRRHLVVGEKNQAVIDFMKAQNYTEYAFTGINSIFVDQQQIDKMIQR